MQQHYPDIPMVIPEIPNYPEPAKALLLDIVEQQQGKDLRFIGSSMGGYLSTFLVEQFGGKAVLINPAVRPFELLAKYLGPQVNPYTGVEFNLNQGHTEQLAQMYQPTLAKPGSYWALLQTADETLDYREAQEKYRDGKLTIEEGGDHSFQGYTDHLPDIGRFLFDH